MTKPKKNTNAVALGRKGGKRGGPARAAALSPEARRKIAQKGAAARWPASATTKHVSLSNQDLATIRERCERAREALDEAHGILEALRVRHGDALSVPEEIIPGVGDSFYAVWEIVEFIDEALAASKAMERAVDRPLLGKAGGL